MRTAPIIGLAFIIGCSHASQQHGDPALREVNPDEPGLVFTAAVVDAPPKVVRCPPAKYPATLREAKVDGQVVIELVVDTLGHPEPRSLRTVKSPHDSLSITARADVLGCEFTPGRIRGRPVRVLTQVPVDFDLKE